MRNRNNEERTHVRSVRSRAASRCITGVLLASLLGALAPEAARAHTVQLCWKDDGAVTTFYAGTYHGPSEGPSPVGQIIIDGFGYPFTGYVLSLPPDIDGCNSCDPGYPEVVHWQTFTSGFSNASHTISFDSSTVIQSPWCEFPPATFGGGSCADADFDGICNSVDSCPLDFDNDADADGFCGDVDTCPNVFNPSQDPSACAGEVCGNGTIEGSEECDDGNGAGGDGCSALCTLESPPVCGNGSVESGEACDDGNTDAGDCCSATCQFEAGGSACADDGDACTTDLCDGAGTCAHAAGNAGTSCRAAAGPCDAPEVCDGTSSGCPADAKVTSECRGADGECDLAESCDGVSDDCPADSRKPFGEVCSSDGNICTDDVCDGSGGCGVDNTAPCSDGVFCNGVDTCGGGTCQHAGDPCPGTDCNTCQEATDSCFDPDETPCTDDADVCTRDRCDGAGTCAHPPIALAEVCNWAIVGGSDSIDAKVRTRFGVQIGGGVCADRAILGVDSVLLGDASWALLGESGTTVKLRGPGVLGSGNAVTGGGCLKGGLGIEVFESGVERVCCDDGAVNLPGGGVVDACGLHEAVAECATAKAQVADDITLLNSLEATDSLGALSCSPESPCTIVAPDDFNVIDVERIRLSMEGVLTIDTLGNADAIVILRLARGIKGKLGASILLAGGAEAQNVAIYSADGSCSFGESTTGAGTLFCPNGLVQMKLGSYWQGAISAGRSVHLRDDVVLDHVPFLGLAD
jgi:cysteine-rich repeat protein